MGDYKIAASIMNDCKLGTSQVDKIYLGNELLWSKTSDILTAIRGTVTITKPSTVSLTLVDFVAPMSASIIYGVCWSFATSQPQVFDDHFVKNTIINGFISLTWGTLTEKTSYTFLDGKTYYFRSYITVNGISYYSSTINTVQT